MSLASGLASDVRRLLVLGFFGAGSLMVFSSCSSGHYEEVAAKPPLEKITLREGRVVLYPLRASSQSDLIDLSIFDGFKPGMNFADARRLVGPPAASERNQWGPYYVYNRAGGRVVIALEDRRSGDASFKAWRLYGYPSDKKLSSMLSPSVLDQLEGRLPERVDLVLMSSEHERPALGVTLEDDNIKELTWYRDELGMVDGPSRSGA